MEQNEIIKALDNFHSRILNSNLAEKITESEMMAIINALSLIKELTEENERLRERNIVLEQKFIILNREEIPVLKVQEKGE